MTEVEQSPLWNCTGIDSNIFGILTENVKHFLFRFILKVAKDEDDDNIVNMADVKTIFKDLDNDGDGNVELDEFLVNKISDFGVGSEPPS